MQHPNNEIQRVTPADWDATLEDGLVNLLVDSVSCGASVGFLPPLDVATATDYWHSVRAEIARDTNILLVAHDRQTVLGAVQLAISAKPNGRHRGEVQKLMVHATARRLGIGKALMQAVEGVALSQGRLLLVLDTRKGDAAAALYDKLGYSLVGEIPAYARSASGVLHTTCFYYKQLKAAGPTNTGAKAVEGIKSTGL